MVFFTGEDKEMLLHSLKELSKEFYEEFGTFDDRIAEEMQFWDNFFLKEKENKTIVFGDDEKQTEKRTNISTSVNNINILKRKYELDEFEVLNGNYNLRYEQEVLKNPNYVFE